MKALLVTVSVAVVGISSVQAQMFRPSVGSGAVVGAVAGGLIGGHNGDRWAQGALIGAAAGALIGAALTPQERGYASSAPAYEVPPTGQRVFSHQVVPAAPTVPDAPMVSAAPTVIERVAPQVVYVEREPTVVYVQAPPPPPRVVYVAPRPVISLEYDYYSGPRYHDGYEYDYRDYRPRHPHHNDGYGRDHGRGDACDFGRGDGRDPGHGHGHGHRHGRGRGNRR